MASPIRGFALLLAAGLLISCEGVRQSTPTGPIHREQTADPDLSVGQGPSNASSGTPIVEPYQAATFPTGGKIILSSPHPDDVVVTPYVDFVGTAPADTVLSLNDVIAVAGSDGSFSARVPLEEGPNEIQCTASNLEGNEVDFSVIVTYDPESP